MASALQKLLRKPPPTRFITAFHPSQVPNPLNLNPIIALHRECHRPISPTSTPSAVTEDFIGSAMVFPSFPFGFVASKPIFASGFCPSEAEDVGLEDSRIVRADSVKKKRKRKMNKHKYQKLRKRMKRQT